MKTRDEALALFKKDTAAHEMTIVRDDGVHRHLRFRKPAGQGSEYWFELVTWPGRLCISGDMGDYVFSRLDDMFEFFRTDQRRDEIGINPGYWGEKLMAVDKHGDFLSFDMNRLREIVKERYDEYLEDHELSAEEREDLWEGLESEVLTLNRESEEGAHDALYNFSWRDFKFADTWEYSLTDYSFHFLWCCYAIGWGIRQYDLAKAAEMRAAA